MQAGGFYRDCQHPQTYHVYRHRPSKHALGGFHSNFVIRRTVSRVQPSLVSSAQCCCTFNTHNKKAEGMHRYLQTRHNTAHAAPRLQQAHGKAQVAVLRPGRQPLIAGMVAGSPA